MTERRILFSDVVFFRKIFVFFSEIFFTDFYMGFFSMFRRRARYTNDPIKADREEFKKYQLTLQIMKKTVEGYELTLALMKPAHDELERNMQLLFTDPSGERVIKQASMLSGHAKDAFDESKSLYIDMKDRVDKLNAELSFLEHQLIEREKAYSPKVHYELKLEKLKARQSQHGTEKIERNLRKSSAATNAWNELDASVVRELRRVLDNRLKTVSEIIDMHTAHLSKYYAICNQKVVVLPPMVEMPRPPSISAEIKVDETPMSPVVAEEPMTVVEEVKAIEPTPMVEKKTPRNPTQPL